MKKTLLTLTLISFLVILLAPIIVLGQGIQSCTLTRDLTTITGRVNCTKDATISYDSEDAICCFFNTVYKIIDWVFTVLLAIAIFLGLAGAYEILTSSGDEAKVKKGRNYILYAIVGVVIALISKALPSFIRLLVI